MDPQLIIPPSIVQKIADNQFKITLGQMQFDVDENFVREMFHSARRALGIYLK